MKKVAFILEEDDIYSSSSGNSLTLTLHDLLNHGFKQFIPFVIGRKNNTPFPGREFIPIDATDRKGYLTNIRNALKHIQPDIIVSLQSFRLALRAKSWDQKAPVILYRHNLVRKKGLLSSWLFGHRIQRIDHFVFCSHYIRDHFTKQYPKTSEQTSVVWNGFDLGTWNPTAPELRNKEIVLAGRCHPEKGIEEAALAIAKVLQQKPEWRARMLLSLTGGFKPLLTKVNGIAAPFRERFSVRQDATFEDVKTAYENAAICLVPSVWAEPFGRVAAEGHLGGCCVISSGSGGLKEVSADSASYLTEITPEAISAALIKMIENPEIRESLACKGKIRANQLFSVGDSVNIFEKALLTTLNR